jgi:hypothetical protein
MFPGDRLDNRKAAVLVNDTLVLGVLVVARDCEASGMRAHRLILGEGEVEQRSARSVAALANEDELVDTDRAEPNA